MLGSSAAVASVAVASLMGLGFLAQRQVATSAFDRLEATQVSQDAERIRVGLESWMSLLRNYGATNSIWDASYADLAKGDRAAFASDFPPADVRGIYGLDGVVAVGLDGAVRAGGLAAGDEYAALPAGLDARVLGALYDRSAQAGDGRCGTVRAATEAYVFCGFAARRSDARGADVGGLVFLRALTGQGAAALGDELSMPLGVRTEAAAVRSAATLASRFGDLGVSTEVRDDGRIDLGVRVPAVGGGAVVLRADRPRPIHAEAVRVSTRLMTLTGGLGLLVLGVALWTSSREVRRRVRPLRAATEQVVLTGDRSVRVAEQGSGALAGLSLDINRMLDSLAAQDEALAGATAEREQQAREAQEQQRASARMLRERAQAAVDDTVVAVMVELREVTARAEAVRTTVTAIDDRASAAAEVTRTAQAVVATGQRTADDATTNLRQVGGIIDTIATVAAQTHLLALNATIEAARAGHAGRGFAVVADEVKQLAASTATSTGQITGTLTALQQDVSALTGAIEELSTVVGGVRTQAGELLGITAEQRETMAGLDDRLREAMQRVGDLSTVTDTIERRGHERFPGSGTVVLTRDGGPPPTEARVLDVSPSGARVEVADPVPVGTAVRVAVPGGSRPVAAHVARTAPGGRGTHLGLAFDGSDPAALAELLDHVRVGT